MTGPHRQRNPSTTTVEGMLVTSDGARIGPSFSCNASFSSRSSFNPSTGKRTAAGYGDDDDDDEESPMFERNEESSRQWSLGNTETRAVTRIRRLVFGGLSMLSLAVAVLVYFLVRESQVDSFEDQYREDASKVLQSFALTLELTMGNMDVLALSIASYARGSNQTWPYVTVPDFGSRAEKARALTQAVYMNLYMYVLPEERHPWETYSAEYGPQWVADVMDLQERQGTFQDTLEELGVADFDDVTFWNVIHDYDEWDKEESEQGKVGLLPDDPGPFFPMWQTTPMIPVDPPYNWDLLSTPFIDDILAVRDTHKTVFSETYLIAEPDDFEVMEQNEAEAEWVSAYVVTGEDPNEPMVDIYYPIIADSPNWVTIPMESDEYVPAEHRLGGILSASIYWRDWIKGILSEEKNQLVAVWHSPCNPSFTYEINGPHVRFLGVGDFHKSRFDDLGISSSIQDLEQSTFRNHIFKGIPLNQDSACPFALHLYPSSSMEDEYLTNKPAVFCGIALAIFACGAIAFLIYDHYVERRNRTVMQAAEKTDAIVSNLLPAEIRDRLYRNAATERTGKGDHYAGDDEGEGSGSSEFRPSIFGHGPLAELYPSATVVFCDIVGFPAWASTREPQDVFQLLEEIYSKWDKVAYRHGVFKIETVGDCYTAVAGLPEKRDDHVVAVARFARDILSEWADLTKKLEIKLGPDTTNLAIRVGCHTGPVTAGILRGTMTRYQLFGDTVNTAERMQCTSEPGWAQLSTASANMLKSCGKERWIRKRTECVDVQGKGSMETYWLLLKRPSKLSTDANPQYSAVAAGMSTIQDTTSSDDSGQSDEEDQDGSESDLVVSEGIKLKESSKLDRLVEWNAQVLADLLKLVVSARDHRKVDRFSDMEMAEQAIGGADVTATVLDEFAEIIELPVVTAAELARRHRRSLRQEDLDPEVMAQLRKYLHTVATMYRENPFHSFEHATHVTASVQKLLSRIVKVNADRADVDVGSGTNVQVAWKDLVGHSYGITSDPLTQFAVVLSAVIHDCDHPGVPNAQLVKEGTQASHLYKQKSIAEQNSVDLCWQLLMEPDFRKLRGCIYQNENELHRFRQLIVNTVMATDIVDKELQALRKARWNAAFSDQLVDAISGDDLNHLNRKATIVIEHLIQASDVCHTMQHWDIYVDWNERFFMEQYGAFMAGRSDVDPSLGWYKGEIGFFDFYVIPLAKKLDTCGVFGVTSHEFLDYAQANRNEWVARGKDCVTAYVAKFCAMHPSKKK